jgi:RHS repeat-associated protein
METDASYTPTGSRFKTEFVYDGRGRLRVRKDYTWPSSGWVLQAETRYLYDGMRVIQERNSANTPTVAYTRGQDLAGSLEGAGGIGGLRARSQGYSGGTWGTHSFYHADAGGNVTCLLNSSQTIVASYRYDPYGRTLSASGTLASANVYRFSSKEIHPSSGLYYYGYRFYDPNTQRWLNRDPIDEIGHMVLFEGETGFSPASGESDGPNLYSFVGNDPVGYVDPHGLSKATCLGSCMVLCMVGVDVLNPPPCVWSPPPFASIGAVWLSTYMAATMECPKGPSGKACREARKAAQKIINSLVKKIGLKAGSRAIPVIGWALVAIDAARCADQCTTACTDK